MRRRSHPYFLALLAGFILLPLGAASALETIQEPPIDPGIGLDQEPDPDAWAAELQKKLNDEVDKVRDDPNSGDTIPGGGGSDIGDIGGELGSTLTENWAITATIAAGFLVVGFIGWILANRYVDPRIALANPQRSMLYGFIKGNPGVHLKQLSVEFKMKTSTVLWHIRKLEHAELVRSKKANGYRVFYPVSGGLEARQVSEAVTALGNDNARAVFSFLSQNPGSLLRHAVDRLGINGGTIRWHAKKLKRAGLVRELDAPFMQGRLEVTELGQRAWTQVKGTMPTPARDEAPATTQVEEITVRSP